MFPPIVMMLCGNTLRSHSVCHGSGHDEKETLSLRRNFGYSLLGLNDELRLGLLHHDADVLLQEAY